MKLKNKRTGEIGELQVTEKHCSVTVGNGTANCGIRIYSSLTQLFKEWEDYKEPKGYFYIRDGGNIDYYRKEGSITERHNSIGNYFETREEAEKAVEKLKAWKLLRDECKIKFNGIIRDERAMLKGVRLTYDRHQVTFDRMQECMDALHLLFGGEDE